MPIFTSEGLSTAPVSDNLDNGWYHMMILAADPVVSPEKGTPGLKLNLAVQGGPVQEATGIVPIGKRVYFTIYIPASGQGRALGQMRLARVLRAVEVPQTDNLDTDLLIGKELLCKNKQRDYNGEPTMDFIDFKPLSESPTTPSAGDASASTGNVI